MSNRETSRYILFAVIPAVGHINPLLQQAQEMQHRGWRSALATTEEYRDHVRRTAPEVDFVSLGNVPDDLMKKFADETAYASAEPNFLKAMARTTHLLLDALWPLLFDGLVAALRLDRPDIMVVDNATVAGFDAAEAEGIPFVVNNPDLLSLLPFRLMPAANDIPLPFSGLSIHAMTPFRQLAHQVIAPFVRLAGDQFLKRLSKRLNTCRSSRGLPPTDYARRLANTLIMTDCAFPLEYWRALPPLIQMVGPMLPETIEPLPHDYDEWLSDGPPVVYVNMGTIALPPKKQLLKMLAAFRSNEFRVLWILKNEQRHLLASDEIPSTVRIESWGPSPRAILAHPNVRAFVSHCGINSVHESLQAGTPIVGIPMFADQYDMSIRVQDARCGLSLNKVRFTAKELNEAILRVLREDTFRLAIPAIQESFKKAGGIPRAADLIEERYAAVRKARRD